MKIKSFLSFGLLVYASVSVGATSEKLLPSGESERVMRILERERFCTTPNGMGLPCFDAVVADFGCTKDRARTGEYITVCKGNSANYPYRQLVTEGSEADEIIRILTTDSARQVHCYASVAIGAVIFSYECKVSANSEI